MLLSNCDCCIVDCPSIPGSAEVDLRFIFTSFDCQLCPPPILDWTNVPTLGAGTCVWTAQQMLPGCIHQATVTWSVFNGGTLRVEYIINCGGNAWYFQGNLPCAAPCGFGPHLVPATTFNLNCNFVIFCYEGPGDTCELNFHS